MPKISNNRITIFNKDIHRNINVVINYNSEFKFYSVLPDEFSEAVKHTNDELLEKYGIETRTKKGSIKVTNPFVSSENEKDCLQKFQKAVEYLITVSIEQRDVIIIFYEPHDNCRYGGFKENEQHPQIGFRFSLTYAVETKSGDKKVYNIYNDYEVFGETKTNREEIHLWNNRNTVIPDTPANREFLETLYKNLYSLNKKIAQFTENEKSVLKLIESNPKMLGF